MRAREVITAQGRAGVRVSEVITAQGRARMRASEERAANRYRSGSRAYACTPERVLEER